MAAPQAKAPIPNEDEELARRLQEQWLSEDTAGPGGGVGGDFQVIDANTVSKRGDWDRAVQDWTQDGFA